MQVLEIRTLGTPDPMDCKISANDKFSLSPGSVLIQVSLYIKSAQEWKADEDISTYKGEKQNDGGMA